MKDINTLVGIPFTETGFDFSGCNCWGIIHLFHKLFLNIEVPTYEGLYKNTEDKAAALLINEGRESWDKIPKGSERYGDVIVLRVHSLPWHVGMVVKPGTMLHIEKGANSVIETYKGMKWRDRVLGFYRHR